MIWAMLLTFILFSYSYSSQWLSQFNCWRDIREKVTTMKHNCELRQHLQSNFPLKTLLEITERWSCLLKSLCCDGKCLTSVTVYVCLSDTMATPYKAFSVSLSFSLVWHKYRQMVWHKAPFSAVTGTYGAQNVRNLSVILHPSSVFCTTVITLHHNTTIACLKRTKQTWLFASHTHDV